MTGWKQVFVDDFTEPLSLGKFSGCSDAQSPSSAYCNGLKSSPHYYNNWWAYPTGWPDTAQECRLYGPNQHGCPLNYKPPVGGEYHPEDVVSVSDGAMHIHMYRPSNGGVNHTATLVPRACMNRKYGLFTERFKLVHYAPGFKSAHEFNVNQFEIDYPEAGGEYAEGISAFVHGGAELAYDAHAKWTDWHTTSIEWRSNVLKFWLDGRLIGSTSRGVPNVNMDWLLQNESALAAPYASNGASVQLDLDWVSCYAPA